MLIVAWGSAKLIPSELSSEIEKEEVVAHSNEKKSEMRAVWISYLEFSGAGMKNMTKSKFEAYVDKMFQNIKGLELNTVIVQVRPMSDAVYQSAYFPWSAYASGKQGRTPGYDPLAIMVKSAHKNGLKIHAWLNPYRVTITGTNVKSLARNNPARKWRSSKSNSKKRNVLTYNGALYYNPAKNDVQSLITKGVKEIVKNYKVDGIHFDDYFYPTMGAKYKSAFDAKEYKAYVKSCQKKKKKVQSIIEWRRSNISKLVKKVYTTVKSVDKKVVFGISPAGNMANLYAKDKYYVDVKKWMSTSGYVDYICPQVYWSFTNKYCPYTKTVKQWASFKKSKKVKLYIGLAAYRAGISKKEAKAIGDIGWSTSKKELRKQVETGRNISNVDGFVFYRYENLFSSRLKEERSNLKKVL